MQMSSQQTQARLPGSAGLGVIRDNLPSRKQTHSFGRRHDFGGAGTRKHVYDKSRVESDGFPTTKAMGGEKEAWGFGLPGAGLEKEDKTMMAAKVGAPMIRGWDDAGFPGGHP